MGNLLSACGGGGGGGKSPAVDGVIAKPSGAGKPAADAQNAPSTTRFGKDIQFSASSLALPKKATSAGSVKKDADAPPDAVAKLFPKEDASAAPEQSQAAADSGIGGGGEHVDSTRASATQHILTTVEVSPSPDGQHSSKAPSVAGSAGNSRTAVSASQEQHAQPQQVAAPAPAPVPTVAVTPSQPATPVLDAFIEKLLAQDTAAAADTAQNTFPLKNSEIVSICVQVRELFLAEPAMVDVEAPVKIVGDTHGQYHDLLRMFRLCGFPPQTSYLFLGDYVDRGKQGLETILLLFCYKLKYRGKIVLLRGNHEAANVNRVYGFFDECKRRCTTKIWKSFCDVFNAMPIAALVAKKIFCVHGGLSPDLQRIKEVQNIRRPTEVPETGLINDLLWSDPNDAVETWEENDRGVSFLFGRKVVKNFLERNALDLICRAHMVVEDGYEFFGDRQLVTIFSAPNYCGEFNNCAAIMCVSSELLCSFEILKPADYAGKFSANGGAAASGTGTPAKKPLNRKS